MSERLLRNVLSPWLSNWWLRNVLGPWLGNWWLRNVLNVSLLDGRRLDNIDVFHWICWGYDFFDGLVFLVLNIIPSRLNNSVIIEGVGIIEVLIRDSGVGRPRSGGDKVSSHDNEIVVGVVVHEVGVREMSIRHSHIDLSESGLFDDDGEVVPWVGIVEVFVRDSSSGMGDWYAHLKISAWRVVDKNWVVIHRLVVKEV